MKKVLLRILILLFIVCLATVNWVYIKSKSDYLVTAYGNLISEIAEKQTEQLKPLINGEITIDKIHLLHKILATSSLMEEHNAIDLQIYKIDDKMIYDFHQYNEGIINPDQSERYSIALNNENTIVTLTSINTVGGKKHYQILIPVIDDNGRHSYNFNYIFDQVKLRSLLNSYLLFFVSSSLLILLIIYYIRRYITLENEKRIGEILGYISYELFPKKNAKTTLKYLEPFTGLERKIAYLLAKRKDLEGKYIDLSDKYNLLVKNSNDGILMEDLDGTIYFCNQRLAAILGYKFASDVKGHNIKDYFYDKETRLRYQRENSTRKNIHSSTYKANLRKTDGEMITCLISGSSRLDTNGKLIGYYGTVSDMTLLSKTESKAENEFKIRSEVLAQLRIPFAIVNTEDNLILDLNEAFGKFVDRPMVDVINSDFMTNISKFHEVSTFIQNNEEYHKSSVIEVFEPQINKFLLILIQPMVYDKKSCNNYIFIDMTLQRANSKYQNMILNRGKKFFFILNKVNKIVYLSPSFTGITGKEIGYFRAYIPQIITSSKTSSNFSLSLSNKQNNKIVFTITLVEDQQDNKIFMGLLLK